jgi:hypothetical protein
MKEIKEICNKIFLRLDEKADKPNWKEPYHATQTNVWFRSTS